MITAWANHLPDDKKEEFLKYISRSKRVLNRLKDLFTEDLKGLDNKETSVENFDLPNWDYRQAYANGYKAALKKYIRLVDLDQQKEIQ